MLRENFGTCAKGFPTQGKQIKTNGLYCLIFRGIDSNILNKDEMYIL